jgi:hypothetical protein
MGPLECPNTECANFAEVHAKALGIDIPETESEHHEPMYFWSNYHTDCGDC